MLPPRPTRAQLYDELDRIENLWREACEKYRNATLVSEGKSGYYVSAATAIERYVEERS